MKAKKKLFQSLALCLALSLSMGMIVVAAVGSTATSKDTLTKQDLEQTYGKYQKIDINSITGEGGNPPEISGAASASAAEKAWYEYITYSSQAVASLRIDDDRRLLFYDPFDYANAMIMDVTGEENDWSSANSLEISYTTGNSISEGKETSSETQTSVEVAEGKDVDFSYSKGMSLAVTKGWSQTHSNSNTISIGSETTFGGKIAGLKAEFTAGANYSNESSFSVSEDNSFTSEDSLSETHGWTEVANRVTKATGSSSSTNTSWSTEDSKTVTQVYNAAYFNAAGSPLQWKVVQYTVYMPMKCELQCKVNGEWITTDYQYCLLTTMQGTCRAYMKNTQPYIEHWGTGEAVFWDDFWDGFLSEEALLEAYKNKLYPDN